MKERIKGRKLLRLFLVCVLGTALLSGCGGRLQVREERARRGCGTGDGRTDPAQEGGEEGEGRARRRQRGADRGGLAREVHDEGKGHDGGDRQDCHAQRVDGARQDSL